MSPLGPNLLAALEAKGNHFFPAPVFTNHRFYLRLFKCPFVCDNVFSIHDEPNIAKLNTFSDITMQALHQDTIACFNAYLFAPGFHHGIH